MEHTLTAVVRADERVAIVAKAEEKWVCGEGGDPLIRLTVEIPKLGPPFKYVHRGLSALSYYYYASNTKNCEPILKKCDRFPQELRKLSVTSYLESQV